MNTKKLTLSALLIAIGTLLGSIVVIPVGIANCYPIQHTINILSAVLVGPVYAVMNAFLISLLRNMLGTGTLLAFPGSLIGALFAGLLYKKFHNEIYAIFGEIIGTGMIGALLAFPIAKFVMGNEAVAFAFIIPFSVSTIGGGIIAYFLLISLRQYIRR
ncbi:energy coupling factor transporter S component ThiW [Natranaerovirga hydrolytica]|uniref:Energy coupling factor transporter S component ThiW n=1 Tax=Natranaerovirga hydrolytica TaxID=680378 RepID=A0A4R1N383_9FIRM|nr:energy coupling factor transporter S component ThiW [Natranaerovirga hydrolytica]TCK98494.1 energy coupling factor transporter S component ThiW [Natranaerovirga hydrolytica]